MKNLKNIYEKGDEKVWQKIQVIIKQRKNEKSKNENSDPLVILILNRRKCDG